MDFKNIIENRRSYRSLIHVEITSEIIKKLGRAAQLMPSCYNKQPWRFIFVKEEPNLSRMKKEALAEGNSWANNASMIITVFTKKDMDCVIKEREYYLFDTGMATASLILQATELNLVAHPIAGYSPKKTREILNISEEYNIITLLIIGKKNPELNPILNEWQIEAENTRPERKPIEKIINLEKF